MKAMSALNPSKPLEEMPKVRWKQKKYSKDLRFCKERTSRWMSLCLIALESSANLADLTVREDGREVQSLIVPCEVLLVWNHSTSRQGWVYCNKTRQNKATDRPCKIWFETIAVSSIWALSIQQKSPVQIFGIFAGRMERVRPLPRIRCHVPCNTGHAGWPFVVFDIHCLILVRRKRTSETLSKSQNLI